MSRLWRKLKRWINRNAWWPVLDMLGKTPSCPYPVRTNFLWANASISTHYYLSDAISNDERSHIRNLVKADGYHHMLIYALNENDYGGGRPVSPFSGAFLRSPVVPEKVEQWREMLRDLIFEHEIWPHLWIFADDSPHIRRCMAHDPERLINAIRHIVPVLDPYIATYCLGLEVDEWAGGQHANVDMVGRALRRMTDKPIGIHQTTGRYDMMHFGWVDHGIVQCGFGRDNHTADPATAKRIVREARAAIGRPVWAGEYSRYGESEQAKAVGGALLDAGAAAALNGVHRDHL